jgi:hypothetical protein
MAIERKETEMRRIVPLALLLAGFAFADRAAAQTAAPAPAPTLGTAPPGAGPMGRGRMAGPGRGMRGPGGGGMGMCPVLVENAERLEVKKLADGVTMTITSSDPAEVARIQKMAEAMRLMHEAATQ